MGYYGTDNLAGGRTHYGYVAGILSLSSSGPRLPGDPGHAETFDYPVCHAVVEGVTIADLINIDSRNLDKIVAVARQLESKGVRFVATSCGLFSAFHCEIAEALRVPFLSSALQLVPFLNGFVAQGQKIAVVTGHAGILTEKHLRYSGFNLDDVVVKGMEDYPEFARIVIDGGSDLDPQSFRHDMREAALSLKACGEPIGMVVLECPNPIAFKDEVQKVLQVPVFDIIGLIDFFAAGCRLRSYSARFM